jgi:hypothetical protein
VPLFQSPASLKSVSESSDDEDNRSTHETFSPMYGPFVNPYPKGIKLMSEREADECGKHGEVLRWSSDSERDDVPITATLKAVKDKVEAVMPQGEEAVGAGIARDFGKDLGVFKGQVAHVEAVRRRHVYHVKYEDGDSEDFDEEEYKYAYDLRQALDNGRPVPDLFENGNEHDGLSSDNGVSLDDVVGGEKITSRSKRVRRTSKVQSNESPSKRKRVKRLHGDAEKEPKKRKTLKKKESKTYNAETILEAYNAESEYGVALRAMPPAELKMAVDKLNKSAAKGIKGTVKEKLLTSKIAITCVEKLNSHLVAQRVSENDMFRKAALAKFVRLGDSAAVSVDDWVEVDGDRSPGWNSEGGIAMVTHCYPLHPHSPNPNPNPYP